MQQYSSFLISISSEDIEDSASKMDDLSHKWVELQTNVSRTNEAIRISTLRKEEIEKVISNYINLPHSVSLSRTCRKSRT